MTAIGRWRTNAMSGFILGKGCLSKGLLTISIDYNSFSVMNFLCCLRATGGTVDVNGQATAGENGHRIILNNWVVLVKVVVLSLRLAVWIHDDLSSFG